jgi:alpha-galactosidase
MSVVFDASTRLARQQDRVHAWCAMSLLAPLPASGEPATGWKNSLASKMGCMNSRLLLMAIFLSTPVPLLLSGHAPLRYTISDMPQSDAGSVQSNPTSFAAHLTEKTDSEGFPSPTAWDKATPLKFDTDWQGKNTDPQRATEVRLLWTNDTLFIRFACRYRTITVFPDARPDGWRYELWDRDVAETFLQPDTSDPLIYREFEVSPNAYWIDLAVSHGKIAELHSGLRRRVRKDEKAQSWTAELALPMKSLTLRFDPKHAWRVNFFRIEGETEPRFYAAWSPTHSPKPNFHVPSAFGTLEFHD